MGMSDDAATMRVAIAYLMVLGMLVLLSKMSLSSTRADPMVVRTLSDSSLAMTTGHHTATYGSVGLMEP